MKQLAQKHYTENEIKEILQFKQSKRNVTFKYELLDRDDKNIGVLESVSGSLSYATFAQVKATANFKLIEHDFSNIDFLNDRIKPIFKLHMPDGGYAEWSMGIFMLNTPKRIYNGTVFSRDVNAYDKTLILLEDKFEKSYLIEKNSNVINAVIKIIGDAGIKNIDIPANESMLLSDKEIEPNTTKITAINELLGLINYETLHADENGIMKSNPYIRPSFKKIEWYYLDDKFGLMLNDASFEEDAFSAYNVYSASVSNPEIEKPLTATYINENPASSISTVSRGRRIVRDRYELSDGTTQEILEEFVRRMALEGSQIYSYVEFSTVLMPMHDYANKLYVKHKALPLPGAFDETRWSMELKAGGVMKHNCRRVVEI